MSEKEDLEAAAAAIFCKCYQRETGSPAELLRHNPTPKPDSTCCIGNIQIDVEIAHLYGTSIDAQNLLTRPRRKPLSTQEKTNNNIKPLNARVLGELNQILKNKSDKKYNSNETWLVIRNAFPLWSKQDFEQNLSEIAYPQHHPFEKIWLICDRQGNTGLIELRI
ncbi:hypothetical protein ACRS3X_24490 [Ectopseudomonas hydrolytica]|uniref:hypothetical protein n=1 Tax=Ectopseudomonas hydrolytica TaxID=2493633 RepID=UPI003EE03921